MIRHSQSTSAGSSNYNAATATVYIDVCQSRPGNRLVIPDRYHVWNDTGSDAFERCRNSTRTGTHGALTYTQVSGTVLNTGEDQAFKVDVTGSSNYNAATATVHIDVAKADQVITWSDPTGITYGTALGATQVKL